MAVVNVGDVIGGRYRLENVLGQGGMAVVYKGKNDGTLQSCAVKLILPYLAAQPGINARFVEESRVGSRIGESPYIVRVTDAGVDERLGVAFLVMELLDGETMANAIARGPMARALVATLVEQLGEALDQAHEHGVVHRDIKPSNLFLTVDRKKRPILKVMDFGIAKLLGDTHKTATEVGTMAYAAPEQQGPQFRERARKRGAQIQNEISAQTDIWALGLVVYEMLTGASAGQYWGATTAGDIVVALYDAVAGMDPASLRAGEQKGLLPSRFDAWFERCVAMDSRKRWPTAGAACAELVKVLGQKSTFPPKPPVKPAPIVQTSIAGLVETFDPQNAPAPPPPGPVVPRPVITGPQTSIAGLVETFDPQNAPAPLPQPARVARPVFRGPPQTSIVDVIQ
ncbi:MAG: serine/threonine-protein kinase, partial [Myxococcales bacterium]